MTLKYFKISLLLMISLLMTSFSLFVISCSSNYNWITKKIIYIYDGDTFKTSDNTRYRLMGVDTPEIELHFTKTTGIEYFYAKKAKEYASNLLIDKNAIFLENNIDKYGRTTARIKVNNIDISLKMIRVGLARIAYISCNRNNMYYYNDDKFINKLLVNEQFAKNNNLGFWKNKYSMRQIFPKWNVTRPTGC